MYENLHLESRGGFADTSYWSSSGHGIPSAWAHNFATGADYNTSLKIASFSVRAVRSF